MRKTGLYQFLYQWAAKPAESAYNEIKWARKHGTERRMESTDISPRKSCTRGLGTANLKLAKEEFMGMLTSAGSDATISPPPPERLKQFPPAPRTRPAA